jgi:hypothetical protein
MLKIAAIEYIEKKKLITPEKYETMYQRVSHAAVLGDAGPETQG